MDERSSSAHTCKFCTLTVAQCIFHSQHICVIQTVFVRFSSTSAGADPPHRPQPSLSFQPLAVLYYANISPLIRAVKCSNIDFQFGYCQDTAHYITLTRAWCSFRLCETLIHILVVSKEHSLITVFASFSML